MRFLERVPMVLRARLIGMRERDPAEGGVAERITGCRLAIGSEEEARLRIDEGVTPAIEHNAGNIAFGIEAGTAKHFRHLLANFAFIVAKGRREQFHAAPVALFGCWEPRLGEVDEES